MPPRDRWSRRSSTAFGTVCSVALKFSTSNERDALSGFLDQQRDALIRKVRGVSDADARRAPTASSLSLLGLLKHSAVWEERWFQGIVAGRSLPDGWPERNPSAPGEDFVVDEDDTVEKWVARSAVQLPSAARPQELRPGFVCVR